MKETPVIRFDWAIKYILRDKANFDVLEGFLSAVLGREIKILNILESESNQDDEADKFNRVDLLAENQDGEKLIIEIQNNREVHYLERLLYGTSKLVVENLNLGMPYKSIKKVISISILYFSLSSSKDDYVYYGKTEFRGIHSHRLLKLGRRQQKTLAQIEASQLFPEYYLIEVEKFQDVIAGDLDEWIYLLKNEAVRDDFQSLHIDKARQKLDYLKLPPAQKKRYERYLENLAIETDMIESSREEGREEGLTEGLTKGILQTALKMKQKGMNTALIAEITGLSTAEIERLDEGEQS